MAVSHISHVFLKICLSAYLNSTFILLMSKLIFSSHAKERMLSSSFHDPQNCLLEMSYAA